MPEKYVIKDIPDKIPVGVGLHHGSSLSPYFFAMIMDVG